MVKKGILKYNHLIFVWTRTLIVLFMVLKWQLNQWEYCNSLNGDARCWELSQRSAFGPCYSSSL